MSDITDRLSAVSPEERQRILVEKVSAERADLGRLNGGRVLDTLKHAGLIVGDRVRYVNALGEEGVGYVSHFFQRTHRTGESTLAEALTVFAAAMNERQIDQGIKQGVTPIILSENGEYSTHHGQGLPQKVESGR